MGENDKKKSVSDEESFFEKGCIDML